MAGTLKTIAAKVETWLKARQAISRAEKIKAKLEPDIKKALGEAPDKSREFGVTTLTLSEFPRRYFDAKAAEEALGAETLAPFWKETPVTQIRVK